MSLARTSRGLFITFEGIDGSGKTTQVGMLKEFLERHGRSVHVAREPGGTPAGERIRELLLGSDMLEPWTEASLFAAARAELVACVVKPALECGTDVILDRYIDSSLAYQAHARCLDVNSVRAWNLSVVQDLMPDRTFLLSFPAEDASLRLGTQLRLFPVSGLKGPLDRIERESLGFLRAAEEAYRFLASEEPDRFVEIDGSQPKKKIASLIRSSVRALLDGKRAETASFSA